MVLPVRFPGEGAAVADVMEETGNGHGLLIQSLRPGDGGPDARHAHGVGQAVIPVSGVFRQLLPQKAGGLPDVLCQGQLLSRSARAQLSGYFSRR